MQKTVTVRVDRLKKHPRYGKRYRVSGVLKAHDEQGEYRPGDVVVIHETRPLSREKRWRVVELVKRTVETEEKEVEGEKMSDAHIGI